MTEVGGAAPTTVRLVEADDVGYIGIAPSDAPFEDVIWALWKAKRSASRATHARRREEAT